VAVSMAVNPVCDPVQNQMQQALIVSLPIENF
jgi:hypothetical protein